MNGGSESLGNVSVPRSHSLRGNGRKRTMPSTVQLDLFGGSVVMGPPRTFAMPVGPIKCECGNVSIPRMIGYQTQYAYTRPSEEDIRGWEFVHRYSRWELEAAIWVTCDACQFVCSGCDSVRDHDDYHRCSRCDYCSDCCECFYCASCCEPCDYRDACGDCDYCSECCACERCYRCNYVARHGVCGDHHCDECCTCDDADDDDSSVEIVSTYRSGMLAIGRTFGVELEIVGIGPNRAAAIIAATGLPTAGYVGYRHDMCHVWKVVTDSSVHGGCEVVSPILRGEDGFEQLRIAMLALLANGADVDRQCGTHVHHGMPNATGAELARVVKFYDASHSAIDRWHETRRRGRSEWSGPCMRDTGILESATTCDDAKRHAAGFPRYASVNVTSFPKYETLEFRQHAGTLDYVRLAAWIRTGQAIINAALVGHAGTNDVATLADVLVAHGATEQDLATLERI